MTNSKKYPNYPRTKEEYDAWIKTEEGKRWYKEEMKQASKEVLRIAFPSLSAMPPGLAILAILSIVVCVMFTLMGL